MLDDQKSRRKFGCISPVCATYLGGGGQSIVIGANSRKRVVVGVYDTKTQETNMSMRISGSQRCCCLISLVLVTCGPAAAQYKDSLGGNWNNPASATITNIIMDRYARRRLERSFAAKRAGANSTAPTSSSHEAEPAAKLNDVALQFRSTGTQLKTREIAN